jgi:enoyl-CoA hydratase/carnithine racemase
MTAVPLALTQFTITVPYPGYWRVTFDNPPINLMNAGTAAELQEIVTAVENTDGLRVVVFDSANPDFSFARYDFSGGGLPTTPGPTGLPPFLDLTVRLSRAPVISIAEIAGRARGGGNEFALACDMRFAAVETAVFGQPELGSGLIPGGGGIERLATPAADLGDHVDALARRIATFDPAAIATAKRMIDRRTLPIPDDLLESQYATVKAAQSPAIVDRFRWVSTHAKAAGADFDLRMGQHLGACCRCPSSPTPPPCWAMPCRATPTTGRPPRGPCLCVAIRRTRTRP